MKRTSSLVLVLLSLTGIISSCSTEELLTPTASTQANFSVSLSNDGYYPCTASFQNLSVNALGYLWDFGNGLTSNETDPVIDFDEPGLFNVTLTCTGPNSVYYNNLIKTVVVNIKDPAAGKTHVLYYTTREATGGNVYLVFLDDIAPQPQAFSGSGLSRPYGMAVDTARKKIYVSDYQNGAIYRYNADGQGMETWLDVTVAGQEAVDYPHGLLVIGEKVYWGRSGGIYRANLDGTGIEPFLNTGATTPEFPLDMAYDHQNQKIFFVNDKYDYSGGIFSVNLDGSGLTSIVPDVDCTALDLDIPNGKMYVTAYALDGSEFSENGLYRMNLDGTGITKIGDFGSKATWGIALDHRDELLYWSYKITNSDPDGKIIRANPDGTGPEDWLTGISPHAMVITDIKL